MGLSPTRLLITLVITTSVGLHQKLMLQTTSSLLHYWSLDL